MIRRYALVLLTLSAATVSIGPAVAEPANWSQWRGELRDGTVPDGVLPAKLDGALELIWQREHSPSYSGPVVFQGVIYTTETVNKSLEKVTAYRLKDGEQLWSAQWSGAMAVPFFAAENGDWIRATPACSPQGLVVVGMRDYLVCLDPETGGKRWVVDCPADLGSPLPMFGANSSPVIDGDSVYMQTGDATVRLSMADGSVIWKTLSTAETKEEGAFSSPIITTLCDQRQLVVQTRSELCGVDLATGDVLWRQPVTAYRGMNILTPLVIGDRVFTSAHSGNAQLFEITRQGDRWNVGEVWRGKQQAYMSSPVLAADRIVMHLKNERFTALDLATGEASFTSRPVAKYASMVTDGQQVMALTDDGTLMLIDPSGDEFDLVDQRKVAEDSWAHVAVSGDHLIVRDLAALKVFRIKSSE